MKGIFLPLDPRAEVRGKGVSHSRAVVFKRGGWDPLWGGESQKDGSHHLRMLPSILSWE